MLDHEAMRWGRSLKPGDSVSLQTPTPIKAVVKQVRPWRQHTQLRLVTAGVDQSDLALGQRVPLQMPPLHPGQLQPQRLRHAQPHAQGRRREDR
jgi:hypothetical protein